MAVTYIDRGALRNCTSEYTEILEMVGDNSLSIKRKTRVTGVTGVTRVTQVAKVALKTLPITSANPTESLIERLLREGYRPVINELGEGFFEQSNSEQISQSIIDFSHINEFGEALEKRISSATHVNQGIGMSLNQYESIQNKSIQANDLKLQEILELITGNKLYAMGRPVSITHLDLSGKGIGNTEAKAVAEAIKSCPWLIHLDLSHNNIEGAGAKVLAEVIKNCLWLAYLDLGYNRMGADGAMGIMEAIRTCPCLVHLSILDNEIGPAGYKAIIEMYSRFQKHAVHPNLDHIC